MPNETNTSRLRSCATCHAPIIWLLTATGKRMPTEAAAVTPEDMLFDPTRHISHFATCPDAKRHRRA